MAFRVALIVCVLQAVLALRMDQAPLKPPDYSNLGKTIRNYNNATYPKPLESLDQCQNRKTVSVAGLSRSGSNSLMVITGIWMTMVDPNFAGPHWYTDFEPTYFHQLKANGVSQLIQQDKPIGWVTGLTDVFLTSHRNPVDMLMSVKLTYGDGDCDQTMSGQVLIYDTAERCCGDVAYDMAIETLSEDPRLVVRSVGAALGLCDEMLSQDWVNYVYNIYLDNLPEQDGRETWTNERQKESVRAWAHGKVFDNPECKAWYDRQGRFLKNEGTILAKKNEEEQNQKHARLETKAQKEEVKEEAYEEADRQEERDDPFGEYP